MKDDKILLRIKRKYTKDEEMGLLINKLKETEVELGKYKSENVELQYKLNNIPNMNYEKDLKGYKKTISLLQKKINSNEYKIENRKLKKENRKILGNYLSLLVKFNKIK